MLASICNLLNYHKAKIIKHEGGIRMGNVKPLSEDTINKIEEIYNDAVILCLSLKKFNKDMLCKVYKLDSETCDELIKTLIINKVADYKDDSNELEINKNYNHSDYLLERELIEDAKNNIIEHKKNTELKVKNNINIIFGVIAIIVFCTSVYFGFREPMSLLIVIPLCLLAVSLTEKIGVIPVLLIVIVVCFSSLFWVNSMTPIWGDRYDEKLKYEELKEKADEVERDNYRQLIQAESLVKQTLKDPSSADFRNSRTLNNGAVCGQVNAKNSFGAYTGFRNFIQKDSIVLVDDGSGDFDKYWNIYCN